MNRAFTRVSAMLLSVMLALTSVPSSFASTVDTGSETSYSVQKKAKVQTRAAVSGGSDYAAVLRADKAADDSQTAAVSGYTQQVETKLSEAGGDLSATYFEQDKYLSEPTGEKNGQSTYTVTLENGYVGPQIQRPVPEGQDIVIIEDASASMNDRVQYENEGVQKFLQRMKKVNNQRIQNAKAGLYTDFKPDGKTDAEITAWMKNNNKLLRLIGVESFNYTTYTKWKQDGGSYVLTDSEVSAIASASALRNGYPGGPDLKDLTGTDKALQNVRSWISNPAGTSVVLLTDGEPYGDWSNDDLSCGNTDLIMFNSTTANNAISIAKSMKQQGISIYASYMFYRSDWNNSSFQRALSTQDISAITMPPYTNISAVTLSLISSDYPNGGHLGTVSGGTGLDWTFTVDKTNANGFGTYMKLMQNESEIADSIAAIAGEIDSYSISKSEKDGRYAATGAYILDDISHPFSLNGDVNSIRVYQVPRVPKNLDATGHPADAKNVTAFTWGEREDITDQVSVTLDGNRIKVTGYNYESNALTNYDHDVYLPDDQKPADPSKYQKGDYGYKLVVEFPIYAKRSFGGNDIETNDSTTSGFYPSTPGSEAIKTYPVWTENTGMNPSKNKYVALYPVPMVDLKVNYAIVGSDQIIYAPQTAELLNLVSESSDIYGCCIFNVGNTETERNAYFAARGEYESKKNEYDKLKSYYDEQYQKFASGGPEQIAKLVVIENELKDLKAEVSEKRTVYESFYAYIPDGENNAYVDITYTLTSPSGKTVATMSIPHGTALSGETDNSGNIHWVYADGDGATIKESGTYTISATVLPVKTTRAESYTGSSAADDTCQAETYTKKQDAYIYQLQITVKDTAKRPGASIDFQDDANETVFTAVENDAWNEVHWVDAKWVCTDGHTPSDPAKEPGKAGLRVGETPLGHVTLGRTTDISEADGTKFVSKTAEDGSVIPVRISVTRKIGNLNNNISLNDQSKLTVSNMSDDDHLYGAFSSLVWKHECSVVDDCDNNELQTARNEIDNGKTTGQEITRFLIHVSETPLPDVVKETSTPTILPGNDISWKVTVSNTNAETNEHRKTTKAQMMDILPYDQDGRMNPNDNTDTGSSFGGDLYFKTISADCASASEMKDLFADGTAKFYYTTDTAVRTASREDWYKGAIKWTEVTPSVNGNTVTFSVPQDAVAVKSDTKLAFGEQLVFNMTANVKNPDDQKNKDTYINQAVVGNDDESKDSEPVVTKVTTLVISGTVWYDIDGNGMIDNAEEKADSLSVSLYRERTNESTESITLDGTSLEAVYNSKEEKITPYITGDDGYFEFNNLLPGTYYVVATNFSSDYKVTAKQAEGTDNALNSKAEETMPAGQTAWIKKIVVSDKSVPYQNIGLVVQKGTLTIQKAMEDGKLYYPSSMTDEQKAELKKGFVFKLTNNATGDEYTSTLILDSEHTDGVSAVIEDIPLGTYTLKEVSDIGYNIVSMTGEEGSLSYNAETKSATIVFSSGNTQVKALVVNKATELVPGTYPGSTVANHIGTAVPISLTVDYAHGDINDTSAVSYTFKESDFNNMTVWYDNGTYRDFTGMYRQDADGTITKVSDDRLKFSEVTLSPATVTNESNTSDSGNRIKVIAYYSERSKRLSDQFSVGVNLMPVYKFTVVFHANGTSFGGSDTNSVRFMYNDAKGANDIISGIYRLPDGHDGWTYAGWNTASDGSGVNYGSLTALNELGSAKSGAKRIDLYAHWTTTVTFNASGGTLTGGTSAAEQAVNGLAAGTITVTIGSTAATNLSGVCAGKQFMWWNTAANGTGTELTKYGQITGPVTFYAIYMTTLYNFTNGPQTFMAPTSGQYKIECWGASGGKDTYSGRGAYTSGTIHMNAGDVIYVYVGGAGETFNGDGYSGATDVRLISGVWDNFDSLKSRIMVAAGGGCGANATDPGGQLIRLYGGYGGTLTGGAGVHQAIPGYEPVAYPTPTGATQTSGGVGYQVYNIYKQEGMLKSQGTFGKSGPVLSKNDGTGHWLTWGYGGGGYYGGSMSAMDGNWYSASGGSSYVSGYPGCNSVAAESTASNIVHTGSPYHYSGIVFANPVMIAGNSSMPAANGGTEVGHFGNGVAKFTIVSRD